MGLLAVDEQHGVLNLVRPAEKRLVEERLRADNVPAVGRVAAALVVAARAFVVGVIVLHELRHILGQRVDDATGPFVSTVLVVLGALGGDGAALLHALGLRVLALEIALHVHLAHVVHRGGDGSFYARVDGCGVDGHAAETADADDADALRINVVEVREEIDSREEVLGVDVRRSHATGFAAALARERRVEGDGQESPLRHVLRIESARLLLHGAKRP